MINPDFLSSLNSQKLISLDRYFDEMVELYKSKKLPKVLLLNGKKGIGKFTLVIHFLNYVYTQNEPKKYNLKEKIINQESIFYKNLLNQTNQDIILIKAEEGKNIKIEDIRNLKILISKTSLSSNPRFTVIDDVEFINENSVNALLKSLEEPLDNNFFILINNQQADLIKTISSRCLKSNIFLNNTEIKNVVNYLVKERNIVDLIDFDFDLTPGLFLHFNEIFAKYGIDKHDQIFNKINKLLNHYKKQKDKSLINLTIFLIDRFFHELIGKNENKLEFLLNVKTSIINNINDLIYYNLNINSVLNSIEIKLKNV
jgi:DNA polymerase-3 subunit delta'